MFIRCVCAKLAVAHAGLWKGHKGLEEPKGWEGRRHESDNERGSQGGGR